MGNKGKPHSLLQPSPRAIAIDRLSSFFSARAFLSRRTCSKRQTQNAGHRRLGRPRKALQDEPRSKPIAAFSARAGLWSVLTSPGLPAGRPGDADSFLRPRARRRERTDCPCFVAMRARKPCFRLRRRLLGWYVLLVIGADFPNSFSGASIRAV